MTLSTRGWTINARNGQEIDFVNEVTVRPLSRAERRALPDCVDPRVLISVEDENTRGGYYVLPASLFEEEP